MHVLVDRVRVRGVELVEWVAVVLSPQGDIVRVGEIRREVDRRSSFPAEREDGSYAGLRLERRPLDSATINPRQGVRLDGRFHQSRSWMQDARAEEGNRKSFHADGRR